MEQVLGQQFELVITYVEFRLYFVTNFRLVRKIGAIREQFRLVNEYLLDF